MFNICSKHGQKFGKMNGNVHPISNSSLCNHLNLTDISSCHVHADESHHWWRNCITVMEIYGWRKLGPPQTKSLHNRNAIISGNTWNKDLSDGPTENATCITTPPTLKLQRNHASERPECSGQSVTAPNLNQQRRILTSTAPAISTGSRYVGAQVQLAAKAPHSPWGPQ